MRDGKHTESIATLQTQGQKWKEHDVRRYVSDKGKKMGTLERWGRNASKRKIESKGGEEKEERLDVSVGHPHETSIYRNKQQ